MRRRSEEELRGGEAFDNLHGSAAKRTSPQRVNGQRRRGGARRTVHDLYFEPKYEEFRSRTIWSLSNAFTSAFKELEPIPQFKATAQLGEFLECRFSQSF
jgi:hypothetical protein